MFLPQHTSEQTANKNNNSDQQLQLTQAEAKACQMTEAEVKQEEMCLRQHGRGILPLSIKNIITAFDQTSIEDRIQNKVQVYGRDTFLVQIMGSITAMEASGSGQAVRINDGSGEITVMIYEDEEKQKLDIVKQTRQATSYVFTKYFCIQKCKKKRIFALFEFCFL